MSENVRAKLQALIEFRSHLKSFNQTLKDEFQSISSHLHSVEQYWDDEKYREFRDYHSKVHVGIKKYLETTEDQEKHLRRLIKALEDYIKSHA